MNLCIRPSAATKPCIHVLLEHRPQIEFANLDHELLRSLDASRLRPVGKPNLECFSCAIIIDPSREVAAVAEVRAVGARSAAEVVSVRRVHAVDVHSNVVVTRVVVREAPVGIELHGEQVVARVPIVRGVQKTHGGPSISLGASVSCEHESKAVCMVWPPTRIPRAVVLAPDLEREGGAEGSDGVGGNIFHPHLILVHHPALGTREYRIAAGIHAERRVAFVVPSIVYHNKLILGLKFWEAKLGVLAVNQAIRDE